MPGAALNQLQLLLVLLLLLARASSGSKWDDDDHNDDDDAFAYSADWEVAPIQEKQQQLQLQRQQQEEQQSTERKVQAELLSMRAAIVAELERRAAVERKEDPMSVGAKSDSGLASVYKGGKKIGKAIDKEAKRKEKNKEKKRRKKKHSLWQRMLLIMPAPVWIGLLFVVGVLVVLLSAGMGYLCYKLCCGAKSKRRAKGVPQTLKHKDLFYGNRPPYGILNYSLEYDLKYSILIITVANCIDLPKGLEDPDPYVIIKVDDETDSNERSKVIKCSTNPVFNFVRKVKIKDKKLLKNMTIRFEIYDWDISKHHSMMARGVVHLSEFGDKLDSLLGRPMFESIELRKGLDPFCRGPGDICFSFSFSQLKKKFTVNVIEGKAVFLMKRNMNPDMETMPNTYAQVILRQLHPTKFETRRSGLVKQCRNPYFNFTCSFTIQDAEKLRSATLFVELYHKTETLRIRRPIGFVKLSANEDPGSLPALHWKEVLRGSGSSIAKWHSLEPGPSRYKVLDKLSDEDLNRDSDDSNDVRG